MLTCIRKALCIVGNHEKKQSDAALFQQGKTPHRHADPVRDAVGVIFSGRKPRTDEFLGRDEACRIL